MFRRAGGQDTQVWRCRALEELTISYPPLSNCAIEAIRSYGFQVKLLHRNNAQTLDAHET